MILMFIAITIQVDVACRAYYQQQYDSTSSSARHRRRRVGKFGMAYDVDDDDEYCDDDDEDDDDDQDDCDENDCDEEDVFLGEGAVGSDPGRVADADDDDDDDDEDGGVSPKEV